MPKKLKKSAAKAPKRAKPKAKPKVKPKARPKAAPKVKAKVKAKPVKAVKKARPVKKAKAAPRKLSLKRELLLEDKLRSKKRAAKEAAHVHKVSTSTEPDGGEIIVGESKFQLGPKKNAGDFHAHNIPFDYGKNRIILLVVDPKFAFVYWEVQQDKMQDALQSIGHNAKLTLRFREMDGGHMWDISIYERVSNWYLKLDHPEQFLSVEIGMKNDRGDFYTIASSNPMKLPRMGLARPGPIKWMLVSPTGERVITEIEEYTDADLELLKKILGPYFFDLFRRGKFSVITGSSSENIFMNLEEVVPLSLSS